MKCLLVYEKMESGVHKHGSGIVQLMMQWKKGDHGRSGKMVVAKKTTF